MLYLAIVPGRQTTNLRSFVRLQSLTYPQKAKHIQILDSQTLRYKLIKCKSQSLVWYQIHK
jgi:hypothetical protein